jgi:mono/diheme cytochrome c family protein
MQMATSGAKRAGIIIGVIVAIGLLVLAWAVVRPGPMAFASGKAVKLADYNGHPTGVPADFTAADPVARGRYLAQAADCEACHTAEGGKPFAGGRPFVTDFGTLYSPNITPDKDTGIGNWSDADFLKAVHEGVTPSGEHLYPAFPYAAYTYLADDDVLAIRKYLATVAPVKNEAPQNALEAPFNQRWLMAFWSDFYNPDKRFEPVADQSPEWNRGAYLVEGLGHCGDCHTPRTALQSLDNRHKFAGGMAEGWRAYNLSSDKDSGIGSWSEADLIQYLTTGHSMNRGTAFGPMAQAVHLSFANLTASDVRAIVTYVRSVPAVPTPDLPAPKMEAAPKDPAQGVALSLDPHGKALFEGVCSGCHGWTGETQSVPHATLTGTRAVNDPTAINVAQAVLHGSKELPNDGSVAMPAFASAYSDRDIAAVSNYVTARFGAQGSAITPEEVRKLREQM